MICHLDAHRKHAINHTPLFIMNQMKQPIEKHIPIQMHHGAVIIFHPAYINSDNNCDHIEQCHRT